MKLSEFMEVYFEDKQNELKECTMKNKRYMMEQHIIPYFGNQMMSEITAGHIIQWQNEMQTKGFSEAYLRMIQNQLTSLFTYASRIYDLHTNPCKKVKRMGSSDNRSLDFWASVYEPSAVSGIIALQGRIQKLQSNFFITRLSLSPSASSRV